MLYMYMFQPFVFNILMLSLYVFHWLSVSQGHVSLTLPGKMNHLSIYLSIYLYFTMVFLTFSVCEGALGLSVLVSMIRTHGNDFFQTFSILQC